MEDFNQGYDPNPYGQKGESGSANGNGGNVPPIDPSLYAAPRGGGLSTAALVLGIIGIVATCCSGFGFPFGIAAVVLALVDRAKQGGKMDGKDVGGLITGIISILISVLLLILVIYLISTPEFSEMLEEIMAEVESGSF